ncbi:MAG: hypothetical protein DRP51_00850 [Candidatus Zixiibacteriota bacterium]|nr:MAG: hypothetical protein DRP51_00850 [candidate division Zixibacteria bacterium]
MNFWQIVYAMSVVIAIFLIMVNGYLRGQLKPIIDAVLSFILILLIIVAFVYWDWRFGIAAIVGSLIFGATIKPLAGSFVRWIRK